MSSGKNGLRVTYNAPVTLTFSLLCIAALGLDLITGGASTRAAFSVYRCPLSPLAFVRFFGHVLGHAGFGHLAGNLGLVLVLGPGLEERYGGRCLAAAMVCTALASGLAQFLFFPGTALLGASGVVFMMVLLSAFGCSNGTGIPLTLVLVAVFYLGGEIVDAFFVRDGVSQAAHIIGGACGVGAGFLFRSPKA